MKTLIVYTSQTGFTKKYAGWIAERTNADLLDLKDAQKKGDTFLKSMMRSYTADGRWRRSWSR